MAVVKLLFFCLYTTVIGDDDTVPYIRGFHLRNLVVSEDVWANIVDVELL